MINFTVVRSNFPVAIKILQLSNIILQFHVCLSRKYIALVYCSLVYGASYCKMITSLARVDFIVFLDQTNINLLNLMLFKIGKVTVKMLHCIKKNI